jgi:hypothetical protein
LADDGPERTPWALDLRLICVEQALQLEFASQLVLLVGDVGKVSLN